jgi:hypothetical protein
MKAQYAIHPSDSDSFNGCIKTLEKLQNYRDMEFRIDIKET